ncbi:PH domain-containing protein [Aeromicrobium sp.]|nr:PH domain-containing protein [Candidatus Saccharibacteria bacterium]
MEPTDTTRLSRENEEDNPLRVMSPGERVVCSLKRHPIGLIGVYATCGILLLLLFGFIGYLPTLIPNLSATDKTYAFVAAVAVAVLISLFGYIAVIIYRGNRWIVTSDSITQVQQTSLFHKQTSQLSLENLEDVTFEQSSILQTIFGYGTLKVETAGEHSKFQFPYCPSPQKCAIDIIEAHEEFMNENQRLGRTTINTSNTSQ